MNFPQDIPAQPFDLFVKWFEEAKNSSEVDDATAMCLSTVSANGYPEGRMVLLKELSSAGFVFFTNAESNKGKALATTARAALTFYWDALGKQVRVQGDVEKVSAEESDRYFASRDRLSQIGAWASQQSRPLSSREELEQRVQAFESKFANAPVPRPPYWGGYRVKPLRIEFWQQGDFRLHNRVCYELGRNSDWTVSRLNP